MKEATRIRAIFAHARTSSYLILLEEVLFVERYPDYLSTRSSVCRYS
jgi:hypothetical protein